MGFLSLLGGKNFKFVAMGAAVLVIFLYWNSRNKTIDQLIIENRELKAEMFIKNQQYEINTNLLKDKIEGQNTAIIKLSDEKSDLEKKVSALREEAEDKNNKLQSDLDNALAVIDSMEKLSCEEGIERAVNIAIMNPWSVEKE